MVLIKQLVSGRDSQTFCHFPSFLWKSYLVFNSGILYSYKSFCVHEPLVQCKKYFCILILSCVAKKQLWLDKITYSSLCISDCKSFRKCTMQLTDELMSYTLAFTVLGVLRKMQKSLNWEELINYLGKCLSILIVITIMKKPDENTPKTLPSPLKFGLYLVILLMWKFQRLSLYKFKEH